MSTYFSHNYLFRCDVCRFVTDNKKDYRRHTLSIKHSKRAGNHAYHHVLPASEPFTPHVNSKVLPPATMYVHPPPMYAPPVEQPIQPAFIFDKRIYKYCEKCGQKYCSKSGLWKHRKTCDGIPKLISNAAVTPAGTGATAMGGAAMGQATAASTTDQELKVMMMDLLKNNQEFQNKLIEMVYSQQSIAANAAATAAAATAAAIASNTASCVNSNNYTGTTNSNNNNNTFNLQFFLNEKCKDAMNITDFASSINLKISDLDDFGRMGYVQGMSKLFIDSLRETDVCKRPIHCSDARRETLYVKDDNKWEREDPQNTKITNAVRVVEHKNIVLVNEWAKQNPKCEDSSTYENAQYINMSRAVLDGEDKNIAKVIKLVAKEVVIEK